MEYRMLYGPGNINWINWAGVPDSENNDGNIMFLRQQREYFDQLLKLYGFVALSDVLKHLGEDRIPTWAGAYGWKRFRNDHVDWLITAPRPRCDFDAIGYELVFDVDILFGRDELANNPYAGKEIKSLFVDDIRARINDVFGIRKENNMGPEKKTTGVIFAAASDPRGLRTIELKIKKVIFNDPATIVFWSDGTKTVVKAGPNDIFDPEKGLAMAISKKMLGNNYKAYGRFKKWLPKEYRNDNAAVSAPASDITKAFAAFGEAVKKGFEK